MAKASVMCFRTSSGVSQAGFLADFTDDTFGEGLVQFEHSPGQFPRAGVAALGSQHAAVRPDDGGGDADAVAGRLDHRGSCRVGWFSCRGV
jgi:hypothetical protein